jgi:nuclear GTP-binding protein
LKQQGLGQNSRRAYLRELRKVVSSADVILLVLDARDPEGTRSRAVEEMVARAGSKKLIFVLNKCDLVPRDVLLGWLAHLRQFHPAVPFKCNIQTQKNNLSGSDERK